MSEVFKVCKTIFYFRLDSYKKKSSLQALTVMHPEIVDAEKLGPKST